VIAAARLYLVNSFAEGPCRGNPAGVCLLPAPRDDDYYRRVAVKVAAPETAFLCEAGDVYSLRWFSANGTEVDLCGHATLASAHILRDKGYAAPDAAIRFATRSGELTATGDGGLITLEFPTEPVDDAAEMADELGHLLGVTPRYTGRTRFDYLVVVEDAATVIDLAPDFARLREVETRGIIVTAASGGPDYDYVSRFFAPRLGIDEDPVTGSAQLCLGVYWSRALGKNPLTGYQASREGGMARVFVKGARTQLSGRAVEAPVPDELQGFIA
jgi:PhzF family phenazine biosynthesis protein